MNIWKKLNNLLAKPAIRFIKLYQYTLSPDKWLPSFWLKGRICAHEPHCSKYSIQVLKRYGFWPGIFYAGDRVLHCTASMQKHYDPDHYKVVFFSSAPIGVPFLEALANDKRFDIVGVVTMPDAPSGRGMEIQPNIIKTTAQNMHTLYKESFEIIPYNNTYKKQIATLYNKCFNNKTFGENYTFDYCFSKIEERKKWKSFVWKILLVNNNFAWYYQAFDSKDMMQYFQEAFDIEEFTKIIQSQKNITLDEIFRLDDIMIEKKYRKKWYFHNLLQDIYKHTLSKNIHYIAIYTAPDKTLLQKYFEEWFKQIGALKEKNTWTQYVILIKDIRNKEWEMPFIQTPESLRIDSKKYAEEAKKFTQRLTEKNPDFLVVIAYGKIIPQAILDIPNIAPINVHGSILPKYRGASPIQSTLLNNDKETGITIMKMDATMDTGNMIDIMRFTIPFNRTTKELIEEMKKIGPKFLNDTLRKFWKKILGEVKQNENKATYCGKIEKESWLIDPRKDSIETIYNKYRAYYLRPKIYFHLPSSETLPTGRQVLWENYQKSSGKRIIIETLKLNEPIYNSNDEVPLFNNIELHPAVEEIILKPEGKKTMNWKEFLNGYMK